ncbi:MAG: hypothetical protein JSS36_01000 [Proteobacteria bacterium]|nr:hypothetical protein [Pseudomonadota bacterium]
MNGQPSVGLQFKLALLVLGLSWLVAELTDQALIAFYSPFTFLAIVLALRLFAVLRRGASRDKPPR